MPKRKKKPLVKPIMRRDWFRRFEEEGQPAADIAKADGYDVRTVRKQIELARQEREGREARFVVLRQALVKHYLDLISFVEKLDSGMIHSSLPMELKSERMWVALHEHLPRFPLWKMIDKMERLNDEVQDIYNRAGQRLREKIAKESTFALISRPGGPGLYINPLIGAMNYHLQANPPCALLELKTSNIGEGLVGIDYIGSCAAVPPDQVSEAKEFILGLMSQVCQWPEYEELKRTLAERARIIEAAREELATIILRRVISGRCRYCPV
jgi:uncharacterized protein (UPF0335 family)